MKICVIGAGAIGGLLAAKLARAGEDVSVIARGAHLAAIASNGLTLIEEGAETVAKVKASDRIADFGEQDLIILGVKAHQVAAVVGDLPAIMGPRTAVLTAQNGIPWWYFFKHGGPHEGRRLESVDPGGVIADHLPIDRVLACVAYQAAEIARPGVIRHIEGDRFTLGEIDGSTSERILRVSEAFTRAGFKAPIVNDARAEIRNVRPPPCLRRLRGDRANLAQDVALPTSAELPLPDDGPTISTNLKNKTAMKTRDDHREHRHRGARVVVSES